MSEKLELPGGGYVSRVDDKKVRLHGEAGEKVVHDQVVVSIAPKFDPQSLSDEGLVKAVNELLYEHGVVGCLFCGKLRPVEEMRGYAYSDSICNNCWEYCPECGNDSWTGHSSRSDTSDNYKKCDECGYKLITSPASG